MEWLSIGSIVRLNNGTKKVMISSRTPLFQNNGETGYYEYGAYLYPEGQITSDMFYFNSEDIAEVVFNGYCDATELELRKRLDSQMSKISYPRLDVKKVNTPE